MNPSNDWDPLADDLRLSKIGDWKTAIYHVVYSRAKFRCEYCGFDLMSSVSAYIGFWELDHILPQRHYSGITGGAVYKYRCLGTDYRNLALACRACNALKSAFDPGEGLIEKSVTDVSPELRAQLIDRVRAHVGALRAAKTRDFEQVRAILERHGDYLGLSSGLASPPTLAQVPTEAQT